MVHDEKQNGADDGRQQAATPAIPKAVKSQPPMTAPTMPSTISTNDMIASQYPHLTDLGVFSTMLRSPKKP